MARIALIEKSISVAKKNDAILKKILKVVLDQTITPLTAMKPKGGNPNLIHRFDEQQETKSWHKSLIPTASR
ncbi:hypothetical protein B9Q31_03145 [Enterobacter kobei]|jgi:hypothetical protein|nr:hypothetical protein B9Q24_03120 [Enterobacter kobei]PJD47242.1 hypothetical protein B9Q33_09440 [Enterobacter kobei]PJD51279.1 hypothetical protein B9Q23_11655 [Enterobacter kobei]PJD53641.1 hypothetical protein B9Q27_13090 [Enterobacter kobei]PJD61167.1 hypothetical protein B9Q31_03145 [Enterobacter kobei]